MELVLATNTLGLGGTESYVMTVADELERLGHEAWVYARAVEPAARERAQRSGVRLRDGKRLPDAPDAVLPQDAAMALELSHRWPGAPQLFVAHSLFDLQAPPMLPGTVSAVVALNDRVVRRASAWATPRRVVRLRQPVDFVRSRPWAPVRERARRVVAVGNNLRGGRRETLARVCARLGLELATVGRHGHPSAAPAREVAEADIVVGYGRSIVEGMALARAAYVWDHAGGDGWVTPERYPALEGDGFSGAAFGAVIDEATLERDLAAYDPAMGAANYDLARTHHSSARHAEELVALLRDLAPAPAPHASPLSELARLVRTEWRSTSRSLGLSEMAEAHQVRAEHAEQELDQLRGVVEELERRAEHAEQAYAEILATRRYQRMLAFARPLDRLRAARARLSRSRDRRRPATEQRAAVPFVIGVPRSGTTLLRLMLNAHPELAIPPETGFIPTVRDGGANGGDPLAAFVRRVTGFETWPDLGLDAGELERELRALEPFALSDAVRTVYRLYAARFGKPRFGDKTPMYTMHIPEILATLPEARFVHIIRDGRDVALSVRPTWFRPGDTISAIAADWRDRIETARRDANEPSTYLEVRYEDLLADPDATLRGVCDFLDLTFDPSMERFWEHGEIGEEELRARAAGPRSRTVPSDARVAHHRRTAQPVSPERAGRWRRELTAAERREFEQVAGRLLRELGYEIAG